MMSDTNISDVISYMKYAYDIMISFSMISCVIYASIYAHHTIKKVKKISLTLSFRDPSTSCTEELSESDLTCPRPHPNRTNVWPTPSK